MFSACNLLKEWLEIVGAAQGFKIDDANHLSKREILANLLISPKIWLKWCNFPKIDGAFVPSAPPLRRPCTVERN